MDLPNSSVTGSAAPAPPSRDTVGPLPALDLDRAREINSRRAEIENPELLRRLRAL